MEWTFRHPIVTIRDREQHDLGVMRTDRAFIVIIRPFERFVYALRGSVMQCTGYRCAILVDATCVWHGTGIRGSRTARSLSGHDGPSATEVMLTGVNRLNR